MRRSFNKEMKQVKEMIKGKNDEGERRKAKEKEEEEEEGILRFRPIGHISTVCKTKNGTPRQTGIVEKARARIKMDKKGQERRERKAYCTGRARNNAK